MILSPGVAKVSDTLEILLLTRKTDCVDRTRRAESASHRARVTTNSSGMQTA